MNLLAIAFATSALASTAAPVAVSQTAAPQRPEIVLTALQQQQLVVLFTNYEVAQNAYTLGINAVLKLYGIQNERDENSNPTWKWDQGRGVLVPPSNAVAPIPTPVPTPGKKK